MSEDTVRDAFEKYFKEKIPCTASPDLYIVNTHYRDGFTDCLWDFWQAAVASKEIKDHEIVCAVNNLRDIAVDYYSHQSLRHRISNVVNELTRAKP